MKVAGNETGVLSGISSFTERCGCWCPRWGSSEGSTSPRL